MAEKEYIEREAAIAEVEEWHDMYPDSDAAREALSLTKRAIRKLPAADVRPVVRCRECKYAPIGDKDGSDLEWPFNEFDENPCPYKCLDNWYSHKPKPDFFCANGKREES
jgi:hypothetical protein